MIGGRTRQLNITRRLPAVGFGLCCAFLIGSAQAAVNGMTPIEFTNTVVVESSAIQFENNPTNNTSSAFVLPKGMEISKTADTSALSSPIVAGDQITYTITARNLGLLGLTNVSVDDSIISAANISLLSGDANANSILDANEIWEWQGVYTVSQADIDTNGGGDGDLDNTVTVSTDELPPLTESVEVPVTQEPSFAVAKVVDQDSISAPALLNYQITITNTGNQTLSAVTPTDTLPDGSAASLSGPVSDIGQSGLLDPGEVWEYTTTYSATQADINAGGTITNSVTVVTAETGADGQTASAATEVTAQPQFVVNKIVDESELSAPATLNYTITVENTGNVSLSGVTPVDTLPDGTVGTLIGPVTDVGIASVLDVAETWTYNISFPVGQASIDAGTDLVNTIAVVSNETGSTPVSDTASTNIVGTPSFSVSKIVDKTSVSAAGLLSYSMSVENTGNVSLTNVVVTDQLSNGTVIALTGPTNDTGTAGVLDVGESWQYVATYNVTQADINAAIDLTNTFTVNTDELDAQSASAVTTIDSTPDMQITKQVDLASVSAPGILSYVIKVTNTGNVTLNNVAPVDTLPDGTPAILTGPVADIGIAGALDVGETWQYTTTYMVRQAEIDDGRPLDNTVVFTSNETGTNPFTAVATTTISPIPAFTVDKTVDQTQISTPATLNYDIVVTNTGNITLTNVVIDDTLPDGSVAVVAGPTGDIGVAGALEVGEVWTYNTSYVVSQADINSGASLINSVTVGTAEAGLVSDAAQTDVDQNPGISIVKAAVETEFTVAGDVINYAFLVGNTGNLLLTNVVVSDPIADAGSVRCLPPGQPVSAQLSSGPFTLAPGEQMNCTALRTVMPFDVATTQIDNQATVSAEDSAGNVVSAESEVISVPLTVIPPVATDDSFNSPVSSVPVTLPGGANDSDGNGDLSAATVSLIGANAQDTDGDGDNDTLAVAGEGTWVVDGVSGNVTFTPLPGFTADPTPVEYTVSDLTGLVSNVAVLSVNYPQTAPVAEDDLKVNPQVPAPSNPTIVNVLADNGSGVDSDAENDLDISSITFVDPNATDTDGDGDADNLIVAGEGSWQIDNVTGEVVFTPEAGFFSDPTPVNYTIADNTGLLSNEATITIDYPQTAPLAVDDEKLDQPLSQPVTVSVVANDSDPEGNLDPTSVMLIDPATGAPVTVLPSAGEGVWRVDPVTGDVTFTPDPGFLSNPTPVEYFLSDTTDIASNPATITITFVEPARIAGTVWLDADRDGQIGDDEQRKSGWTLNLLDSNGNVVATTVTDADGNYLFEELVPAEYTVEFFNENGVFIDSEQTQGPIISGETILLPLPVDPSGVVYDSIARVPVEGVVLNLVNASGTLVDELCLREMQQGQTTTADGLYAFDVLPGADASCGTTEVYRIEIASVPDAFRPNFSSIIRQEGAASCGSPEIGCAVSGTFDSDPVESLCTVDTISATSACEVQPQPDAPADGESTRYFVEFEISSGDQNVIFNHIPIDARANDAEILLSKSADVRESAIGSLIRYTVIAENLKQVPAVEIEIVDTPPAGFVYDQGSVLLTRQGADGSLNTDDDVTTELASVLAEDLTFAEIDFAAEETVQITYVMKVSTGVVNGRYENSVNASGPNGEASNTAVAGVEIISDPVLGEATLIGKVFFDRDRDGIQDAASINELLLSSNYYGTISLPDMPPRDSVEDDPKRRAITINMPRTSDNRFRISTREGTRIDVDQNGTITEAHIGARARGTNAQDLKVCTRHTTGIPTLADGTLGSTPVDVVEIVLSNIGISEPGIPGARLATVSGLLIETDTYGRFSVPDIDVGSIGIGRNYILKVDPSSLEDGARFTTENPYVLRLDNSALNKMNFGVLLREPQDKYSTACEPQLAAAYKTVEVSLGAVFFDTDDASIREDQRGVVADIIKALRDYGGGEITIGANTDSRASHQYNIELAERRAKSVRDVIRRALGDELMSDVKIEVDPAVYQEAER